MICQNVSFDASLRTISRVLTRLVPPKGAFTLLESSDCHFHLIPLMSSYLFSSLTHILSNTPCLTHCWNLLWHVDPEPYSLGRAFHWHPVLRTYRIPSSTILNGAGGLPLVLGSFSLPRRGAISIQRSLGMRLIVGSFLSMLLRLTRRDYLQ